MFALALIAALALCSVSAQDYDDEGGNQGNNDGYGGFSGGGGDDDYAAPRERGVVGAEGSDVNAGYQPQGDEGAGNENYDSDDVAAAASISRPNIIKIIKQSRR